MCCVFGSTKPESCGGMTSGMLKGGQISLSAKDDLLNVGACRLEGEDRATLPLVLSGCRGSKNKEIELM